MDLKNKVVIITGASSGIGAAAAILFAKHGAFISIVGRNEDRLKAVAADCKQYSKVLVIKADITMESDANRVIESTLNAFKKIDVLINNAGVARVATIFDDNVMETFDDVIKTNVRAPLYLTKLAVPHIIATKGNIINVSSVASDSVIIPYMCYCMSKAAVDHLTRQLAVLLAPHGVRVNNVNPGPVATPMFAVAGDPKSPSDLAQLTLLGRGSDPEEVAELMLFLAGERARSITASNYVIDNGYKLKK